MRRDQTALQTEYGKPVEAQLRTGNCELTTARPAKLSCCLPEENNRPSSQNPLRTARPVLAPRVSTDGRRIFLMDAMSFIFRAYHAMARQRGMTTKTGLPTAATYVFVNMLRKLRDDFSPEYLAAVFDVAAPTFRKQEAEAITKVRKFDLKTQTFQEVEYNGYKANRSEMPAELVQQVPYIRRALEAYRIPILELSGYEADDVIGTLARKAVAESYLVYVVSSDKDMLQLVNDKVLVLNPPKDNLICDAAKSGRDSRRSSRARRGRDGPARRLGR